MHPSSLNVLILRKSKSTLFNPCPCPPPAPGHYLSFFFFNALFPLAGTEPGFCANAGLFTHHSLFWLVPASSFLARQLLIPQVRRNGRTPDKHTDIVHRAHTQGNAHTRQCSYAEQSSHTVLIHRTVLTHSNQTVHKAHT